MGAGRGSSWQVYTWTDGGRTLRGSNAAPRTVGKGRYTDTWNGLEDMELFIPEERRADEVIKSLKKKVRMFSRTKNRPQIREAGKAHGLSSRKPLPHRKKHLPRDGP